MLIQAYSGAIFDPMNPSESDIRIEDIAHSLSMICRFNGHCDKFYSVAEHCVRMSEVAHHTIAVHALMHDSAEVYLGDMISPLKKANPYFSVVEGQMLSAIYDKFGLCLPSSLAHKVKEADLRMLITERNQLMPRWIDAKEVWTGIEAEPYDIILGCWTPEEARQRFLDRFNELRGAVCR